MTKSRSTAQSRQSTKPAVLTPPSRPKTIAAAVSLAMVSPAVLATWDNQVEAWVRPGTDRSYGGIEGLLPLSQSGTSLTFADLKFKLGQSGSYEGNVGLGHRFLTGGGDWALGFYGAWDHRRSKNDNSFNQVTAGVEARSEMLDFRFNYYWPLTDRKLLGLGDNYVFEDFSIYQSGIWEEAMKGYDIEAGVLLPLSDKWETRAYAAYYNFEGKDIAPKTDGWRVRLEVRPTRNFVIGLSHQQDDMFDNQTSLELRYIFGKEAKPGVRTLKERMTDPWTRDIDIVVSTPQEGNGSRFGERVPGIDVVHVDSARGSDVTGDGSYERPYATTTYCQTQKCAEGVTNPAVDVADYNVIRLWEGTSQSDGGYAPINLYNGQMLAGEPVTAAMIVGQFHPGRPGAIDVPWNLDLSNAPVINGNGGPAIALTSGNNRIMGVATVSGGIQSGIIDGYGSFSYGPVSGFVDIRNNDIQAYYPGGVGIGLLNYNSTLDVTIGYNRIGAGDTGILLYNVAADGGSATMTASIYGNDIRVIDLYGDSATGVSLFNVAAVDGAATMYAGVYGNTISAASADGGSAMGLSAVNTAKYASSAAQYVGLTGNSIEAVGGYAIGAGFANIAGGYSTAGQFVFAYGNTIGAYGSSSADGVTAINAGKYGDYARQDLILIGNTITASDTIGMDSATGVSLFNSAAYGSSAYQSAQLKYNTITASSVYGNATGVYAYNAALAVDGYSSGPARQNLAILGGSITANGYNGATGVAVVNLAETYGSGSYGYASARQTAALYGTTISAGAYRGDAHGVYAANAGIANMNYSTADGVQTVTLSGNVIGATSTYGNAYGVYASNRAAAGGGYSFAASGQSLDLGNDNSVSATAKYAAYGVSARNAANAYGTDSASFAYQGVTIGDGNVISATGKYAVGVAGHSQSNAIGSYSAAWASQPITIGSGNTIAATSNKDGSSNYSATGIDLSNTVNAIGYAGSAYGIQSLTLGAANTITASAYGDATGISAANSVNASGYNWAGGSQAVNIGGDWWDGGNVISASSTYYSATGIRMGNSADSSGYFSGAYAAQTLGIGSYNSISASGYDANGIALSNAARAWNLSSYAVAGQSLGMGYENTVSALANGYWGSANALMLDNYASADGSSSFAGTGQYAHLGANNAFAATATGTYGSATALSADNAATGWWGSWAQYATADGSQTIVSGDGNAFTASGISGAIRGIALDNSADAGYYATASASQTLTLGSNTQISASASGAWGSATALHAYNSAETWDYYTSAVATQNITVGGGTSFVASATGTYGRATGVSLNNYAYASWWSPNYASASQSFSLGAGSSITATGTYGATGLYASNYAYADGGTAQAMQVVNLNGSAAAPIAITATSTYGPAYGLALYNDLDSHDNYYASTAVQTVTVGNAAITANGDGWSLAVLAFNQAHAHDYTETAVQTVVIGNSALSSNVGDAIYAYNGSANFGYYSGTATQTLVVTGSSVSGGIDTYASGIQMVNYGYHGLQTGSIVANTINSFNDGVAIYNWNGDVQIVTVSGNTFNVGVSPTSADGGGNLQLLTYTP